MHDKKGFTIVELLIVIVVIGILAAITIVAFNGVQDRARDTAIRGAVRDSVTALQKWSILNSKTPIETGVGSNFTGTPTGQGWFQHTTPPRSGYPVSIEGFLIDEGHLPTGFSSNLVSKSATFNNGILMFYACPANNNYVLFASLNSPTSQELASATSVANSCGRSSVITSYGMNYVYQFSAGS